ncbi:GNAT family N-acetyltransferase [Marivita hallyeonensis]|nr:GNAT family N-acetyltransferase [Marivita hallyeonensis]
MLETERLILRQLRPDDADWLAAEIARPEVHQWLTSPPRPYRLEDARGYIDRVRDCPGYRMIERDGTRCGVVSITPKDGDGAAHEIGFWLCREAWGHGLMTEAAAAMIDWHFDRHTVLASGWMQQNAGSESVHRKLGFQETGEVRMIYAHFHGRDVPVVRVRLDRQSWGDVDRTGLRFARSTDAKEGITS